MPLWLMDLLLYILLYSQLIMKSQQIIYQVDAFTTEPFKGNPAGVCILDQEPDSEWMQNIAMEMNLSETAFVFPGKDCRRIRYLHSGS